MKEKVLLDHLKLNITLQRLCKEVIESHGDFENTIIVGVQPRGTLFSNRFIEVLRKIQPKSSFKYGKIDVAFYRDDFGRRDKFIKLNETDIKGTIEDLNVVLVDDVLFSGRTIRAALDALLDYGRPAKVEFLTLVERRLSRQLPISPDYVGIQVDAIASQEVRVRWKEHNGVDEIVMIENEIIL